MLEIPYIVAVIFRVLAHVHLLGLDGRIAVRGRVFGGIRSGCAIEIILLVLHDCMCADLLLGELVLTVKEVKVGSRLRLASGGTRLIKALSRVRAFELHAASFAASNLHLELSTSLNLTEQFTHLVYSSPQFAFRISFAPPPLSHPIVTIGSTLR